MRENELWEVGRSSEWKSSPVDGAWRPTLSSPGGEVGVSAGGSAAGEKLPFIPPVSLKHKLVIYTYIQLREKEERASSPARNSDQRTGREGGVRDTGTKPRERESKGF